MISTRKQLRTCLFTVAVICPIVLFAAAALASQGPGVSAGTASRFAQAVMAIIVYGTSALVVGAGLIGAARRHRAGRGP